MRGWLMGEMKNLDDKWKWRGGLEGKDQYGVKTL